MGRESRASVREAVVTVSDWEWHLTLMRIGGVGELKIWGKYVINEFGLGQISLLSSWIVISFINFRFRSVLKCSPQSSTMQYWALSVNQHHFRVFYKGKVELAHSFIVLAAESPESGGPSVWPLVEAPLAVWHHGGMWEHMQKGEITWWNRKPQ